MKTTRCIAHHLQPYPMLSIEMYIVVSLKQLVGEPAGAIKTLQQYMFSGEECSLALQRREASVEDQCHEAEGCPVCFSNHWTALFGSALCVGDAFIVKLHA